MKVKLFFLIFISTMIISCKATKSGTSKAKDIIGVGVIHKPVIADLEVSQLKVSKTIKVPSSEKIEDIKSKIIRELINENGADLLIEPKFESITKGSKTEITLTGWLAFYKNFRTIEEKDLKLLDVNTNYFKENEISQSIIVTKNK